MAGQSLDSNIYDMKTENYTLTKLEAEQNKWLYNGETFCKVAYLGVNDSPANWREITEDEKQQIEAQNENNLIEDVEPME